MAGPNLPVNLGDIALQSDTENPSDYGRQVYQTHRGKQPADNEMRRPNPPVYPEEFGRYND